MENQLHMSLGMGVWGLREPATVRQVCTYMEIICICVGMRVWGLREPVTMRQLCPYMEIICIYSTPRPILACGMGPERACDSATGVPIYGNHLHM